MARDEQIVDAQEPDDDDEERTLVLGPPFAIAHDCALREGACAAVIECECGQALRLNLTAPDLKQCPQCKRRYTHVLLVALEDNDELAEEALDVIFQANGIELPRRGENPDEDGAELEGDEHAAEVVDNPDDDSEPE